MNAARSMSFALLAAIMLLGALGCASRSERITIRNNSDADLSVWVVFGARSGLSPTGFVGGPGAFNVVVPAHAQQLAHAGLPNRLPLGSIYSATVVLVQSHAEEHWTGFYIPRPEFPNQPSRVVDFNLDITRVENRSSAVARTAKGGQIDIQPVDGTIKNRDVLKQVLEWQQQLPD